MRPGLSKLFWRSALFMLGIALPIWALIAFAVRAIARSAAW